MKEQSWLEYIFLVGAMLLVAYWKWNAPAVAGRLAGVSGRRKSDCVLSFLPFAIMAASPVARSAINYAPASRSWFPPQVHHRAKASRALWWPLLSEAGKFIVVKFFLAYYFALCENFVHKMSNLIFAKNLIQDLKIVFRTRHQTESLSQSTYPSRLLNILSSHTSSWNKLRRCNTFFVSYSWNRFLALAWVGIWRVRRFMSSNEIGRYRRWSRDTNKVSRRRNEKEIPMAICYRRWRSQFYYRSAPNRWTYSYFMDCHIAQGRAKRAIESKL